MNQEYYIAKWKDAVFPAVCAGCGSRGVPLCETCSSSFVQVAMPSCPFCRALTARGETCERDARKFALKGAFIGARINTPLKNSIHALKYRHGRELIPALTRLTIRQMELFGGSFGETLLVPIPADPKRGKERLFNPPDLIAEEISARLGLIVTNILVKKETKQQAGLSRQERLNNLMGAFALKEAADLAGKTIVLVDDIATTFSTLESAAREIKKLNPRRVWSAVIAHGRAF